MSIGTTSIDNIKSLAGKRTSRRVIHEDSEIDDTDTHSELDISLYDMDEGGDMERTGYRLSLCSDGFEAALGDPDVVHEDVDEGVASLHRRNRPATSSVDTATPEYDRATLQHPLQQLYQQNQQLYTLQKHQHAQLQEQQQRFPRAFEAATLSLTSFYESMRESLAPATTLASFQDRGSTRYLPSPLRHSRHSDPTNVASADGPAVDAYDMLGTPPGESVATIPSQSSSAHRDSTPFDRIHLQALQRQPQSLNAFLLLLLISLGLGSGLTIIATDPSTVYGFWLNEVGLLYIRLLHCTAVPMGLCQVIFSVSTLTTRGTFGRLWLKTLGFYLILCVLSILMAILVAGAFRNKLKQTDSLNFQVSSAHFGFHCSNNKYLELNGSTLACSADTFDTSDGSATVFPSFVDMNAVLGLPESIALLSLTEYLFYLVARYVPNNVMKALSADYYNSSMVIATILGEAISRSFRGSGVRGDRGEGRRNPLFRLFVHIYAALFTMLDWLQSLALFAILPIIIGSILVEPANVTLVSSAGTFCLASMLVCAIQGLVLCPILFFWVTRRQPFGWLVKVLPAMLYSAVLGSPMLSLPIATKTVFSSREVPPAVFGTLFPVLSACNCLAQATGLPIILLWLVSYTECNLPLTFTNTAMLFGYAVIFSVGETALPRSFMVYFVIVMRNFCGIKYLPPSPVAISGALLLVGRLNALTNTAVNLMLVRMAACTDEGRMNPHYSDM